MQSMYESLFLCSESQISRDHKHTMAIHDSYLHFDSCVITPAVCAQDYIYIDTKRNYEFHYLDSVFLKS